MTAKPEELSGREQPRLAAPPPMGEGFSDDKARALHMLDEARWRKIEGRNRGADCYGDRRESHLNTGIRLVSAIAKKRPRLNVKSFCDAGVILSTTWPRLRQRPADLLQLTRI